MKSWGRLGFPCVTNGRRYRTENAESNKKNNLFIIKDKQKVDEETKTYTLEQNHKRDEENEDNWDLKASTLLRMTEMFTEFMD